MINENLNNNYSLKVLFGPMFGCELHLPENDYFLIINPALNLQDKTSELVSGREHEHAAYYAKSTLYIPCELSSPNISLHLSERYQDDEGFYFNIEIHDENGNNHKLSLRENDVFIHGHIRLAVKHSDDEWSEDIKHFRSLPLKADTENYNTQNTTSKKRVISILAVLFLSAILLFLSIFIYYKISADQQVISLSELLSGAPSTLEVVKGRENKNIYILAQKSRELEWAKEAINKMNNQDNLSLILLSKNKKDIIDELSQMGYPALQLDYSSPQNPVLALYRTLNHQEEIDLIKTTLQKIPFALNIEFIIKTKEQLVIDARQGLDKLNVHYRLIKTATGYSLVIRDALSDNTLNSLYEFIRIFTQQWGSNVITFPITLDENWLQNKSYLDSAKGYLFLNPRHWYFPLNNKEF